MVKIKPIPIVIKRRVLINKSTGHRYVTIPVALGFQVGDYVLLDGRIVARVWRKNTSLVATVPRNLNKNVIPIDKIDFQEVMKNEFSI